VPVIPNRTTDFLFVRYIGHPQLEINAPYLEEWGDYFVSELQGARDVFAFCHSPENLTAPWLCRVLHKRVAGLTTIPPLPWDEADSSAFEQERLL
jgi:hypothetical protein